MMFRKSWHVHIATEVSLPESRSGTRVLHAGDYVMHEIALSSYDLDSAALKLRLEFSEVFRMHRSGAIRIDGAFP